MNNTLNFDVRQTNISKGMALLMLLCHHLFTSDKDYISLFPLVDGITIDAYISDFCKICVAIFVFLSGYGLYCSYKKFEKKETCIYKFIPCRLKKLMSSYWFYFVLFVPLGFIFGRNPLVIYENNFLYFIIDFLGLSNLFFGFSTYTMNPTWWYMSLAIIINLVYPVIYKLSKKHSLALLFIAIVLLMLYTPLDHPQFSIYFLPLLLGTLFAKYELFSKINVKNQEHKLLSTIMLIAAMVLTFLFRQMLLFENNAFDGVICIPYILFGYLIISRIRFIDRIFEELGKYSGAIFLFHTFLVSLYFQKYTYSFKYPVIIFVMLALSCYVIAVPLDWAQKKICYVLDSLSSRVINKKIKKG